MDFSNLKNLSNQAMVGATKGWVSPTEARSAMAGIGEVAGYLDRMAEAHNGLLRYQVTGETSPEDEQLKEMSDRALALDARHDRLARGIDTVLEGNTLLLNADDQTAAALANLRDRLFPNGMSIVNRTYLEEAGEVELARERLDTEDRALLVQVPTMNENLQEMVDEWIRTGTELGNLERQRIRAAEAATSAEGVSRSDVLAARNQWIRVVRAILAGLDLAEGLDERTLTLILQPLKVAVEKAAQKSAPREQSPEAQPTAP